VGASEERALAANVNVHGPAARSLAIAATRRWRLKEQNTVWFSF
jgi:hypothetical protein